MLIEIRREIILSPRGEDTRVYMRVLEKRRFSTACQVVLMTSKNASNEQKEAAKRVTRMGFTVVEERRRTRKDRLSRSSKRERRRKRKKEKRGGGKKKQRKEEGGLKIAARGSSHTGSRQDYIAESSLRKDHIAFVHRHPCHLTLHAFSVSFSI